MSVQMQSGGMFNSYKIMYSPETHEFLRDLINEVKLTTAQRQQIRKSLKKGEPLPVFSRKLQKASYVDDNLFDLKKNFYFLRRSKDQIIHSGAYERERYRYLDRTVNLEKEKERLRNIMTYGRNIKKTQTEDVSKPEQKKTTENITPEKRVQELVVEIEDRLEFLKEMENIGEVKKYEAIIKEEIAAKLREMKKLNKDKAHGYFKALALPKSKH